MSPGGRFSTDGTCEQALPTVVLPRGEDVSLGDVSMLGADGDAAIERAFTAEQRARLGTPDEDHPDALGLDRLDILALALYVERRDDVTGADAVAIAEDELSSASSD